MKTFSEIENLILSRHTIIKKNDINFLYPVLKKLGDPHKKLGRVIHVTGTNGKGSVAYLLESVLRKSGFKTALFTSPHVENLRERIKFNGIQISEKDFIRIFSAIYPFCRDLSFFEIVTFIAFIYYAEKKPDFSLIEVGIGGEYDTTNVIPDTEICLITSVDFDHRDLLGNSLSEIAGQKAGIIKKNSLCFHPPLPVSAASAVKKRAAERGGEVRVVGNFFSIKKIKPPKNMMVIENKVNGRKYEIGILGTSQTLNASLVRSVFEELVKRGAALTEKGFSQGLKKVEIKARFQLVAKTIAGREKIFIFDGAHNGEAAKTLSDTLGLMGFNDLCFVFSMLNTKDYSQVLREISKKASKIIFTVIDSPKALNPYLLADEYQKINPEAEVSVFPDVESSMLAASAGSGAVCVCGSFYLASEGLKKIRGLK